MTPKSRAVLLAAGLAVALAGGSATMLPSFAATGDSATASRPQHTPSRHLEGRIAFLKAELKITDAQAPLFNAYADTLRADAPQFDQLRDQMRQSRDKPMNAVERMDFRQQVMQLQMTHLQKVSSALKPLYASLSDDQKKTADELLGGHHRHHMWHH
ncbi:MAG TPA: Spy/CpxP family protein refolding chaperone [Candidatus Cybelea sp.]|nr:Spy/CpxP family protein refolding chaperone [Candidatus Cybelea sp.]